MNNSKLLYVSKYTNLIGGAVAQPGETAALMPPPPPTDPNSNSHLEIKADGPAADHIAANGTQQQSYKVGEYASKAAAGIENAAAATVAEMHKMHAMADSVSKNTQATAFGVLWIIFSLVMLILLGMRSNDSKNKGGAFTLFAFGLLFWGLALYFGMGNDQVGESSGYAQASLTISSFFFYFCLYASSDEAGSKKISLWGTIFVVLMSHLFGAFWVSICYSEEKAGSMGHMNIKGTLGRNIGFNIDPAAATAVASA